jgi:hypothetical protein
MQSQRLPPAKATGYYGADGGIMPLFSFGAQPLAPSFLTGSGSHLVLWTSIVLHVVALVLTISANAVYFASDRTSVDLFMGWAVSSITMHALAVLGTLVSTALIKDVLMAPLVNTLGAGLFTGGLLATAKIAYAHSAMPADSAEVVLYNLALFFQGFAASSILANGFCAAAKTGGI